MAEGIRKKAKGGKKNRKFGRNKVWCAAYASRNQRERNKVKRLDRRVAEHPNDKIAKAALDRALGKMGGRRMAAS